MKKLFLPFLVAILFFSCSVKKQVFSQKQDQTVLNGNWELALASFSANLTKDFPEGLPTITFDGTEDLSVYGYDGCNRLNGKAVLKKNNEISFQPNFVSTMLACNKVKSAEFKNALLHTTAYTMTNNVLILKNDSVSLKFHKITLNGKWFLDKIYVGKIKAADLYPYKKPFIVIDINQPVFSGNTACNALKGQLLLYQNTMKFNHITSTKMFCDGVNETVFTNALAKVTHYKLDGTRLVLFENEKKIMELVQQFE
ncbi:META domain-containing protein [Myroides sp. JBRI-B21084]|uniref:META domain-containing protein n=1 Tax=Myroides sp. JBRI-B21084 TaxID=3119977 RepID=UPI0026E39224|nr:META domain-containing protein [Paenimyroides cloacae]WKW47241.1 META domain-containing protein [Paenimyroides cloacae]